MPKGNENGSLMMAKINMAYKNFNMSGKSAKKKLSLKQKRNK